jgi:hypothetical protein
MLCLRNAKDPDSGPGAGQFPGTEYVAAVSQLHTYPNVKTLGVSYGSLVNTKFLTHAVWCQYVHTRWTAEPLSAVQANITKYAGWRNYTEANIQLVSPVG